MLRVFRMLSLMVTSESPITSPSLSEIRYTEADNSDGDRMCNAIECGVRGCTDASINSVDIEVDGAAVARQIRRRLKGEELDYMRTNVRPG